MASSEALSGRGYDNGANKRDQWPGASIQQDELYRALASGRIRSTVKVKDIMVRHEACGLSRSSDEEVDVVKWACRGPRPSVRIRRSTNDQRPSSIRLLTY